MTPLQTDTAQSIIRNIAEAVEKRFHDKGMKDARHAGGARDDTRIVYVYKKTPDHI